MPENNEQRAEFEAFAKMAADADKQGLDADSNIDLANYLAPSPAKTVPDTAKETKVASVEVPDEAKTKTEPERAEIETVEEGEEETEEIEDTEERIPRRTPDQKRKRKEAERFDRNWQEFQRKKRKAARKCGACVRNWRKCAGRNLPRHAEKDERVIRAEGYDSKPQGRGGRRHQEVIESPARKRRSFVRRRLTHSSWPDGRKPKAEMVKEHPDLANIGSPLAKEVNKLLDEPQ